MYTKVIFFSRVKMLKNKAFLQVHKRNNVFHWNVSVEIWHWWEWDERISDIYLFYLYVFYFWIKNPTYLFDPDIFAWIMCSIAGTRNPSVLPDPVWPMAMRSRPDMAMGQPWAWIGIGSWKPDDLKNSVMPSWKLASSKSVKGNGYG